ncbi:MAG: chemotaxis protein CheX [Magnetococcales bacterium]|nr:chemotaxis protein CheX [Magnetococcales bacterium]
MNENLNVFLLDIGSAIGEAVGEIAETMLFVPIEAGAVSLGPCSVTMAHGAWIALDGGVMARFHLIATDTSALRLSCALLGDSRETWDDELGDAFGEVANMIAGGMVTRFENHSHGSVGMTPPTRVTIGEPFPEIRSEVVIVHQEFTLEGEPFAAEMVFPLDFALTKVSP